jgi:predicted nucleotidyltransferase
MAQGNFREYLQADEVWIKKYFYVLRPLLACMWIEQGLGPVPMEFEKLVNAMVSRNDVREAISQLLQRNIAGEELDRGPKMQTLSSFIESELDRQARASVARRRPVAETEPLNQVFREVLGAAWAI